MAAEAGPLFPFSPPLVMKLLMRIGYQDEKEREERPRKMVANLLCSLILSFPLLGNVSPRGRRKRRGATFFS